MLWMKWIETLQEKGQETQNTPFRDFLQFPDSSLAAARYKQLSVSFDFKPRCHSEGAKNSCCTLGAMGKMVVFLPGVY